MSDARANWVALTKECEKRGLPKPYMCPTRLGDSTEVGIDGIFKVFVDEPNSGIKSCLDFVGGYGYRMDQDTNATKVTDYNLSNDPDELWHFACTACQDILKSEGHGGPVDHTLIAKAVLAICAARAVEQKNKENEIW
jgi:hypothetical protein